MQIEAGLMYYKELNEKIRESSDSNIDLKEIFGQRYIGAALKDKTINIHGTPGNAMGAYMNGAIINVFGNAQDAVGDTMNSGRIIIHGNCGDTAGYGMRGGEIFIKGNSGYRTGIHMKQYMDFRPVIIIGGKAGDFLGEYQAGGIIIIFGNGIDGVPVGNFCATGMHGGVMYIKGTTPPNSLDQHIIISEPDKDDIALIESYAKRYSEYFNVSVSSLLNGGFLKLTPNSKNPYKQLYTRN